MKRIGCAFAALGLLMGVATAQSTATLYGKMDMGYGVSNGGDFEGRPGRDGKFQQWGNSKFFSRWGLKGSEDLGNGTKVFFQLESMIDPETGSSGRKMFDRTAVIGLSGNYGSIMAGRQITLHFKVLGQFDAGAGPNITSALGNAGLNASQRFGQGANAPTGMPRFDSALSYTSPTLGGFQAHGLVVLKNEGNHKKNVYSVAGTYKLNGLTLGAAYESKLNNTMSGSWGLGIKYNFDSFVLSGGYFNPHQKIDGHGFYAGISVPIKAFTVGVQIAHNTSMQTVTKTVSPWALEIFTTYNLSKQVHLYTQFGYIDSDAKDFLRASRRFSGSVGIVYDF